MGELIFVGLGLFDCFDISLRGLEEVKKADYVFAEFYTSFMAGFSMECFREIIRKEVTVVSRKILEEENGEPILRKAEKAKVVFLVPGDPLIATTHVDLRLRAEKLGVTTKIIHGASIISAVIGLSGLQNYRFGRSVTVSFPEGALISETPYNVISENKTRGLHTLCFLDIRAEEKRYMTIREALEQLMEIEKKKSKHAISMDSLVVGIARAGAEDVVVKAEKLAKILSYDFGSPPHTLVFPSDRLHFMEAEALLRFAHAPPYVKDLVK